MFQYQDLTYAPPPKQTSDMVSLVGEDIGVSWATTDQWTRPTRETKWETTSPSKT